MARIEELEQLLDCTIHAKVMTGESLEKYQATYNDQEVMLRIYDSLYYGNRFLREGIVLREIQKYNNDRIITPRIIDEWPEYGIRAIEWMNLEPIQSEGLDLKYLFTWIENLTIELPFSLEEDITKHLNQTENIHVAYRSVFEEHVDDLLLDFDWYGGQQTIVHGDLHMANIGKLQDRTVVFDWEYASMGSQYYDKAYFNVMHPELTQFEIGNNWQQLALLVTAHWYLQETQFSPKLAIDWINRIDSIGQ